MPSREQGEGAVADRPAPLLRAACRRFARTGRRAGRYLRACGAACAALLVAVGVAQAEPTHYLVIALDDDGHARVQYHALVERDPGPPREPPTAERRGRRLGNGALEVGINGYRRGRLQFVDAMHVEPAVRSETADAAGRLSGVVASQPPVFALRVPATIDRVLLDLGRGQQMLDLDAIAADAARLPLAAFRSIARTSPKSAASASGNRVDLLIIGDGYGATEQGAFDAHADAVQEQLFDVPPLGDYANLVNVERLFVASPQSGADHPPYLPGCTSISCCADPVAESDPFAGRFRDTMLDARFCTSQIHRLLTIDTGKALAAAAAAPDWDIVLVLVNDEVYGGAGGSLTVASAHPLSALIMVHEYGHRFSRLADEYSAPFPGYPTCSDIGNGSPCEPNVTDQTQRDLIKWRNWIDASTPVPTSGPAAALGLFEGARYRSTGMYRPVHSDCMMNTLASDHFCSVCAEAYVLRLYGGGFGVPAAGIDLIEPGSESPAPATPVQLAADAPARAFTATVLRPSVAGIEVQWWLDGVAIAGATADTHLFAPAAVSIGTHTLELRVVDRSDWLRNDAAEALATHVRQWTIAVGAAGTGAFADGFEPR